MKRAEVDPAMWRVIVLHEEALWTSALMAEVTTQMIVKFGLKYTQNVVHKIVEGMGQETENAKWWTDTRPAATGSGNSGAKA